MWKVGDWVIRDDDSLEGTPFNRGVSYRVTEVNQNNNIRLHIIGEKILTGFYFYNLFRKGMPPRRMEIPWI